MDKKILDCLVDEVIAIIPARGGSKSVPQKNIRLFQGFPLIAYSIAAAKLSKKISRVIVTTDSEEIAQISLKYGAEVPFMRPSEYARDDSPDIEFLVHAIEWLATHEKQVPMYMVHLRPTTPIRDWQLIDKAIEIFCADPEATSLRSAHLCAHPPFKWFQKVRPTDKYISTLFSNLTADEANVARQKFPDVYVPNGYVDVLRLEFIIRSGLMHGDKMIGYLTDCVPDIDTELDLKLLSCYSGSREALDALRQYLVDLNV